MIVKVYHGRDQKPAEVVEPEPTGNGDPCKNPGEKPGKDAGKSRGGTGRDSDCGK
ncbi:MAG: hypothetical protein H5T49_05785 [Hadesarchaea archaeon]|nr:hypothetical protein [Hadesarchaea archaeon]